MFVHFIAHDTANSRIIKETIMRNQSRSLLMLMLICVVYPRPFARHFNIKLSIQGALLV